MKFLVGFDGSNASRAALALAMRHAKALKAHIEVVTSMVKGAAGQSEQIQQAETELAELQRRCEAEGLACGIHLLIRGKSPGEDLVDFAAEHRCDEIYVGVKRRSKVGKILLGSTAQYVIVKAHCPVSTVK
jgi:nucleotide-binding universal stress UspA family protein